MRVVTRLAGSVKAGLALQSGVWTFPNHRGERHHD